MPLEYSPDSVTLLSVVCNMAGKDFKEVINYLDDFLIIGQSFEECRLVLQTLMHLLITLGFDISGHVHEYVFR